MRAITCLVVCVGSIASCSHKDSPSARPTEVSIATAADLEKYVRAGYDDANRMLIAGANADCDALARDLRNFAHQRDVIDEQIAEYRKAHPADARAVDERLAVHAKNLEATAQPTFEHCKGNQAFLDAIASATRPSQTI
jgi:hypothetical protein